MVFGEEVNARNWIPRYSQKLEKGHFVVQEFGGYFTANSPDMHLEQTTQQTEYIYMQIQQQHIKYKNSLCTSKTKEYNKVKSLIKRTFVKLYNIH